MFDSVVVFNLRNNHRVIVELRVSIRVALIANVGLVCLLGIRKTFITLIIHDLVAASVLVMERPDLFQLATKVL